MKYRTKLYIALAGTAVVSTVLALSITFFEVKTFLLRELQSKVKSDAASAAVSIDRQALLAIHTRQDESSPAYARVQQQLRAIRNANRRKDTYVKYIYILAPNLQNPSIYHYVVDAEDQASKDFSHVNQEAHEAHVTMLNEHHQEVYSPNFFLDDEWGSWLVGYAPIYDQHGKYLASVGVNMYAANIMQRLQRLLLIGGFSFVEAFLLALLVGLLLSRQETISLDALHRGVKAIDNGLLSTRINIESDDEFGELASEINHMAQGLEERERLRLNFARYVSTHIMESIIKAEGPVRLEGERRKVTLLFSDIRQFTRLSEKLHPEQVVSLLNEYFAVMVEIIFKNGGMLDKYLGDGMMVEFGVPLDDPKQELHAVQTALEMQRALALLCTKWEAEGKPKIEIGIGIHTGYAVVGNIGSEKRIEYTAIGDSVNVAARIEQLTKVLKTPILISESTVQALNGQFALKPLGPQQLRGRSEPIVIYTLAEN